MSSKKRGLGRGLDALLSTVNATSTSAPPKIEDTVSQMAITALQRGQYQPRQDFHPVALQELADSIRSQGIIQPIVVRALDNNRYEIIAGERRWRAAQLAGLTEVPVLIKTLSDEAAMAMALIENIQREDLNPLEQAIALQRLIDEFTLTHQQVAETIGKSRTTITNLLRLLNLPTDVKTLLERGDLEMGHARALLTLEPARQLEAARTIVAKGLSVRETEHLVRRWQNPAATKAQATPSADIRHLQQHLSERLGAAVTIKHSTKGRGRLVIHYNNLDELDGILAKIH